MHPAFPDACQTLCNHVDWNHPNIAGTPMATFNAVGDTVQAARQFVRYLRERETPQWIYTANYARRVRDNATPAYREEAGRAVRELNTGGAESGYGRILCLPFIPAEHFHAGADEEALTALMHGVLAGRDHWGQWGCQTIFRWFETIQALWPMEECPDDFFIPALAWLLEDAHHAWTFTQRWTEAMLGTGGHNWWAFELCALWKISFYFPEFRDVAKWRAFYPTYVEREVAMSLSADGYSEEQSMSYHWALEEIIAGVMRIVRLNGLPVSETLQRQMEDCAAFAHRIITPDGKTPAFGDHGAVPILDRVREAAAFYEMPEAKYVAEALDSTGASPIAGMLVNPRNFGWAGVDMAPAYDAVTPAAPPLDTALRKAGLYVMRSSWERDAHYLCMEACPRGAVVTSHGHTTLMHFIAHSHGTPVLVDSDAGWETDTSGVWWRTGSFSHNVATADGEHHLPIRSIFRWDQDVRPLVDAWESTPAYSYFSGVHEGYERLPKRVTGTRRKIFGLRGDYWILLDRFTAAGRDDAHAYTQHFQVGLPCRMEADGRVLTTGEAGNLLIVPVEVSPLIKHLEPCPYPQDHYPNPDHLTYTVETDGSALLATVLIPFLGAAVPDVSVRLLPVSTVDRELTPWETTGLEITLNGRRDIYVDVHTHWHQAWTCGGYAGEGRVFHSQLSH
ncbi:MAG: heparinase II/III family protein [Armatimonadota bacterium]